MLTLNDIFKLTGRSVELTSWVMHNHWFPELSGIWKDDDELLQVLQAEGRLRATELVNEHYDGSRYAQMHTVTFDGAPVLIVQEAGRSGRDHRKRWVTDKTVYLEVLRYLTGHMLDVSDDDFLDPAEPMYEEAVLHFYGTDFAPRFGLACEPRHRGATLMPNERGLLPSESTSDLLLLLKKGEADMPRYIRRHDFVMERVRELPREELLQHNPRIVEVNDSTGVDRVLLYRPCKRPLSEPVLSV